MDTLAILGQSNASHLWELSGIATFSATLNALTNKTVSLIEGAVGGTALTKAGVNPPSPHAYWLDHYDTDSPLYAFLQNDLSTLRAVWWVQGEQDAVIGVPQNAYLGALIELHAIIAASAGKAPKDLPFVISPLGNTSRSYTSGWMIRNAHFLAANYPGFLLGAEYIDLPLESDAIHLTAAGRETFATRAATCLAPVIGVASSGSGSLAARSFSFTRDLSLANGTQTVATGLSCAPKLVTFRFGGAASPFLSIGADDGANPHCFYQDGTSSPDYNHDEAHSLVVGAAALGIFYKGHIQTMNADGSITIAWEKTGGTSGTYVIHAEAFA